MSTDSPRADWEAYWLRTVLEDLAESAPAPPPAAEEAER